MPMGVGMGAPGIRGHAGMADAPGLFSLHLTTWLANYFSM